jgi:hypothetical protein
MQGRRYLCVVLTENESLHPLEIALLEEQLGVSEQGEEFKKQTEHENDKTCIAGFLAKGKPFVYLIL